MPRHLNFVFRFPPIQGIYDTHEGTVYMFGDLHEDEIIESINHETLHFVIQKVARRKVSVKLDRIWKRFLEVK